MKLNSFLFIGLRNNKYLRNDDGSPSLVGVFGEAEGKERKCIDEVQKQQSMHNTFNNKEFENYYFK